MAKDQGLYCCFVSNGYMTIDALNMLIDAGLDGMNVDVKGRQEAYERYISGAKVDRVWDVARHAHQRDVHVEVVCLLVTGVSDDYETVDWIVKTHLEKLSCDVPIHFTRYFPARKFTAPPTPLEHLRRAYKRAKESGIRYVYLGNARDLGENTYCPSCGILLIRRSGFATVSVNLTSENRCPSCGEQIPITGNAKTTPLCLCPSSKLISEA